MHLMTAAAVALAALIHIWFFLMESVWFIQAGLALVAVIGGLFLGTTGG